MMREILFRGKRVDNGEWIEGSLWLYGEDAHIDGALDFSEDFWLKVDPATVGQYTGLTDKTGKRIFEGDIVDVNGYAYACRWDEGNVEFGLYNKYESIGIAYIGAFNSEVIGNIHDNPELLEVTHEV